MKERRENKRLKLDANVLIFIDGIEDEISGDINDISEESIGLEFKIPSGFEELIKNSM